jgi:hypothetical protein
LSEICATLTICFSTRIEQRDTNRTTTVLFRRWCSTILIFSSKTRYSSISQKYLINDAMHVTFWRRVIKNNTTHFSFRIPKNSIRFSYYPDECTERSSKK